MTNMLQNQQIQQAKSENTSGLQLWQPSESQQMALSRFPSNEVSTLQLIFLPKLPDVQHNSLMKKHLILCAHLFGLSDPPSDDSIKILIAFCNRFYPQIRPEEITELTQMAIARQLNLSDADLNHFNNLSAFFLGRLINAYLQHRNKIKRQFLQLADEIQHEIDSNIKASKFDRHEALIKMWSDELDALHHAKSSYYTQDVRLFTADACYSIASNVGVFDDQFLAMIIASELPSPKAPDLLTIYDKRDVWAGAMKFFALHTPLEDKSNKLLIEEIVKAQKNASAGTKAAWRMLSHFAAWQVVPDKIAAPSSKKRARQKK